jgi:diacylglycerol kinase (ATP)
MKVAVVAHAGKTVGGGLPELRRALEEAGVADPIWTEVPKSKRAPAAVAEALDNGAELLLAWGGDGMVRRCVNALKDTQVPLAIVPAGTSNLFATHLGIETSARRWRSRCTASAAGSTSAASTTSASR